MPPKPCIQLPAKTCQIRQADTEFLGVFEDHAGIKSRRAELFTRLVVVENRRRLAALVQIKTNTPAGKFRLMNGNGRRQLFGKTCRNRCFSGCFREGQFHLLVRQVHVGLQFVI